MTSDDKTFLVKTALGVLFGVWLPACEPVPSSESGSSSSSSGASSSTSSSSGSSSSGASPNTRQPLNSEKLCSRLINECGQSVTMSSCQGIFTGVVVTPSCSEGLGTASCADLTRNSSPILDACFPPCSGTLASCNGDGTITICTTAGTTNVIDCEAACRADNRVYSGTCGTAYEVSVSDKPQCWCK